MTWSLVRRRRWTRRRSRHRAWPGARYAARSSTDKIVMVTAYDATFAALADEAGVDVVLVGDSLGMVVQGVTNTLPVTLDEAVYHTRLAAGGATRALVVGDLPFGSYQVSPQQAVESSIRLVKEGARRGGQARGRRADGRHHRGHHPGRHPGDGPHRPHPAVLPPHGRAPGAGPVQRQPGRRAGPAPRRRQGRRGRGRVQRRARGHARASWRPRSPPASPSRRSASAPGPSATARCSCSTTCSASRPTSTSSPRPTPTCGPRSSARWRRTPATSGTGAFPDDAHSFH